MAHFITSQVEQHGPKSCQTSIFDTFLECSLHLLRCCCCCSPNCCCPGGQAGKWQAGGTGSKMSSRLLAAMSSRRCEHTGCKGWAVRGDKNCRDHIKVLEQLRRATLVQQISEEKHSKTHHGKQGKHNGHGNAKGRKKIISLVDDGYYHDARGVHSKHTCDSCNKALQLYTGKPVISCAMVLMPLSCNLIFRQ